MNYESFHASPTQCPMLLFFMGYVYEALSYKSEINSQQQNNDHIEFARMPSILTLYI